MSVTVDERLVEAAVGALELFGVHLGTRLGLYRALREHGRSTGIAGALDEVAQAYRSGGGVPYPRYGAGFRSGQGGINRPAFIADLTSSWLPAMADLHARLELPGARIADVGCGHGWSTIALAERYPSAEVVGYDLDPASVAEARAHASGTRARFVTADAARLAADGPFDAVLLLECLHDMARAVEALTACRKALADGGAVVVADENVADAFTAPGDLLERMMYGWSTTHCLPVAMAEQPSAALGTVLRAGTVAELATVAGFRRVEAVDLDAGFFRIYRLTA